LVTGGRAWATWKQPYPDTQVLAGGTYSQSHYQSYLYINSRDGDYRTSNRYQIFGLDPSIGSYANPFFQACKINNPMLGVRINKAVFASGMLWLQPLFCTANTSPDNAHRHQRFLRINPKIQFYFLALPFESHLTRI